MGNEQEKNIVESKKKQTEQKKRRRRQRSKNGSQKPELKKGQEQAKKANTPKKQKPQGQKQPVIIPKIHEPLPICSLCEKPITSIAQAISGSAQGEYHHFDCVLRKIADDEKLLSTQTISYIGRGTFAIVETNEEGKMVFVKRIQYESPEAFAAMKRFVEDHKR